jgi:hypothetical protein
MRYVHLYRFILSTVLRIGAKSKARNTNRGATSNCSDETDQVEILELRYAGGEKKENPIEKWKMVRIQSALYVLKMKQSLLSVQPLLHMGFGNEQMSCAKHNSLQQIQEERWNGLLSTQQASG